MPSLQQIELPRKDDKTTFKPLYPDLDVGTLQAVIKRAKKLNPNYRAPNFLTYFVLTLPAGTDAQKVVETYWRADAVEYAYVEGFPCEPPATPNPVGDELYAKQGYLANVSDGKVGINAKAIWGNPAIGNGSDGEGILLVDLEQGWDFSHADLPTDIPIISGNNRAYHSHGTGVLGVIAAQDSSSLINGYCIGIAPKAKVAVVSQWRDVDGSEVFTTAPAILSAITNTDPATRMKVGDILLLEAQAVLEEFAGYENVPVEIEPAVFEAIRLATNAGVVVIEAAGNGGVDLDELDSPFPDWFTGSKVLTKDGPAKSGALLVASAWPPNRKKRHASCYGSRVDCYAWGAGVVTLDNTSSGNYTDLFDGTSSASAIIAGVALAVQGMIDKRQPGRRLSPQKLREILRDKTYGTEPHSTSNGLIGIMPNLGKLGAAINAGTFDAVTVNASFLEFPISG